MNFGFVRRHPVWTWIVLVLLLTAILVVIYIPRFIKSGLESWLEQQGPISVEIEDVDFNLFTGRLVIETLLARREEAPGRFRWDRAAIAAEWWPLTRRRLMLESVTVRDAVVTVRVADGTWYVGGLKIKAGEKKAKPESSWSFGFGDIDLQNTVLVYLDGEIRKEILVEEAHLDSMQQWNPEKRGEFRLRLRAAGAPITLSGEASPFAPQPQGSGRLEISGFPLDWLAPWAGRAGLDLRQGRLSAGLDIRTRILPAEERLRLAADGKISLNALQGGGAGVRIEKADLAWEGEMEVAAPRAGKPPLVTAEGTVSSPGGTVYLEAPAIRGTVGKLSVRESFFMGTDAVPAGAGFLLQVAGSAGALQAFDTDKKLTLAQLGRVEISEGRIAGKERFEAGRLEATGLRLLQRSEAVGKEQDHFLELSSLAVGKIEASSTGAFAAAAVRLQGVQATVVRNEQGTVTFSPWSFARGGGQERDEETRTGAESPPNALPAIRIGLLEIAGDNRVRFVDRSVEPAVQMTVTPLHARVGNIDSAAGRDAAPTTFDLRLQANGHPLAMQGKARPFGSEITVESRITAEDWPLRLISPYFGPKVDIRRGEVRVDGRLKVRYALDEGNGRYVLDGTLGLARLDGRFAGVGLAGRADWKGHLAVATGQPEEPPQIEAAGALQIPTVTALLPKPSLRLHGAEIAVEGEYAMGVPRVPAGADFLLSLSGTAGAVSGTDTDSGLELFAVDSVQGDELRLAGTRVVTAASLDLRSPRFWERPGRRGGDEPSHLVSADSLRLSGLRRDGPSDLRLKQMRLFALQAIAVRNEKGSLELGPWGGEPDGETASEEQRRPGKEQPLRLRAELIQVEGKSRLLFHDRSVDPAVRLQIDSLTARVENLDTASGTPAPVRIEGEFGRYAPLRIEGRLSTLSADPTMSLSGDLDGFSLLKVTGYIEKYLGYTVRSGQLDLEVDGKVVQGEIQAEASVVLTQLELNPLATEARQETDSDLGFPLETGLSLLRDDQGTITVEVPISGNLQSPEFGIANILQTAFLNALREAALSFFANMGATALGAPVGAALLAKRLIFDRLTAVRFRPVYFPPGMAVLTDGSRDYLKEIAKKMADRPEINLVLCGVAVAEDAALLPQPAGEEALLQLARKRADVVRNTLVELGIAPGRLVQCAPEVLDEQGAKPRVEVGI